MTLFVLMTLIVSAVLIPYGIVIWAKKRINLIKYSHRANVTDEVGFTKRMGIGLIVLGIVSLVCSIIACFESIPNYAPVVMFMVAILATIVYFYLVIKKYNKE